MGQEMGLSKWLQLSRAEQTAYLSRSQEGKALRLQQLSYEEALAQACGLMELWNTLPLPMQNHRPTGLGRVI